MWKRVKTDEPPPCDGETVFIGINEAGFCGCFNYYRTSNNACFYETDDEEIFILGWLDYWKRLESPT